MPSHESPQLKACLPGSDAITLVEIIHKSLSCNSEEDFLSLFPKIQELFPFDFAGVLLGRHDNGNGLFIAHGVNISYPEEWLREYLAKNYFYLDVLTKETFRTNELIHWSLMTMIHDAEVPQEIVSFNMDFGVREGYAHGSSPSAQGKNGSMFCFSSPSMKDDFRTAAILEYLIPHLHLALTHISGNKSTLGNHAVISAREKEVLNWLKQGKSSWEISVILGISESTANYHVYNIMRKLEAVNRPQAVAAAVRLGLIDLA
jgi:DNA-binding CsgD family transcriptional regulator